MSRCCEAEGREDREHAFRPEFSVVSSEILRKRQDLRGTQAMLGLMKNFIFAALALLFCTGTAAAAETTRYVALVNGGKSRAGHQWVTRDGNRYRVDFLFKDNGRGPE